MTSFQPIIIEALCHRPAGKNIIEMGDGTVYDFRDDGTGRQITAVSVEAHATRLLSITEGYRFAGVVMPAASGVLLAAAVGPQGTGEAGTTATTTTVATAPAATPPVPPVAAPTDAEVEVMSLGDLRALFATEIGKPASPKYSAEVLVAKIIAARETARETAATAQA